MAQQKCIIHFAFEATQRLREHSLACDSTKSSTFPSQLAGLSYHLCSALDRLAKESAVNQQHGMRHLRQYLENLNRLYQWPVPSSSSTLPRTAPFDRKHYPNIAKALAQQPKSGTCLETLRSFAATRNPAAHALRTKLLRGINRLLESISTKGETDVTDLPLPEQKQNGKHDYQVYIRNLYNTLSSHCICQVEGRVDPIVTNLRLNNDYNLNEIDNAVSFSVLFLDHPHNHISAGITSVQDKRYQASKIADRVLCRGIRFKEEKRGTTSKRGKIIPLGGLCKEITIKAQSQLAFAVSEQGLELETKPLSLSRQYLLRLPSISLADLLRATDLAPKLRLLLSYILAKAVWQFYDTMWMGQAWNKDTLHFMFEKSDNCPKAVWVNEPFLNHDFDTDNISQDDDTLRIHQFPKILALGIMMMEIELGIDIEDKRSADCINDDGSPVINADLTTALGVFNNDLQAKTDVMGPLKKAIEVCILPTSFDQYQDNIDSIRESLLQRVVRPIEQFYMIAWEHPDETEVKPLDLEILVVRHGSRGNFLPSTPEPRFAASSPINRIEAHLSHDNLTMHQRDDVFPIRQGHNPQSHGTLSAGAAFSSADWFQHLDPLNLVLRAKPKDQDDQWRKSRIAVLDTGVSEALADSEDWVRGYKDFVSGDDDTWQDSTGHGTNAIRLIKMVYNMADIYVARVFEGREACANTHVLMAQAMQHAVREWKADVIAMPSGFPCQHEEIRAAVDEANANHVLIFTAAANYGNVTDVAFPGRLYRDAKLFCMFSTDANARCLHNLNPSPLAGARYSFAVLGENIQLPGMQGPLLSGTSYSAVIGAALAGRILDFSRQPLAQQKMRGVADLSRVEGMSAVFARMARGAVDNGYHCIAPWKIMPSLDHVDGAKRKEAQRAHICETISRALEDMYAN
ncbi:subtilisin-like protein [Apiospora marii]|uniref:Subtilisin-like protein n=1 Tax=Apiospora marii TaxID=335849 RepID=A0ABR1T2S0_9PEZI